jgi:hypothetical protein
MPVQINEVIISATVANEEYATNPIPDNSSQNQAISSNATTVVEIVEEFLKEKTER